MVVARFDFGMNDEAYDTGLHLLDIGSTRYLSRRLELQLKIRIVLHTSILWDENR